ncbi:unnamed protein product, partial [Prorocentrum cordatum]
MLQNLASQTGVSAIGHFAADWARRIGGLAFEAGQLAAAAEQLGGTRILLLIIFLVGVLAGCCCCTTCTLEDYQSRLLLRLCDADEFEHELGTPPTSPTSPLWMAATPDEDIYPHELEVPPLHAMVPCDRTGQPLWRERIGGDGRRLPRPCYGAQWHPSPLEFMELLGSCNARPEGEEVALAAPPEGPPRVDGTATPSDGLARGSGKLVASENRRWLITASEDDSDVNVLADFDACEWYAVCDSLAVVKAGGKVYLAKAVTEKQAESSMDARVMPILHGLDGERRRVFKDAVRGMSETPWTGWPVKGPRTALWCVRFLAEQDSHPRARHTKWRAECGLGPADVGVSDHELAMRALELGAGFDQLNLTELALVELLVRRAQLAEWRHRERLLKSSGDEYLEDEYLYMGTSETRGLLMVCPTLVEHIQAELHKEATLMKEKRKLREERMLSRGQGSGGGGGGGNKALQDKVAAQAAEISKLQAKLKGPQTGSKARQGQYAAQWLSEALHAVNSLYGHGAPRRDLQASCAQLAGIDHVREIIQEAGPPPFSGAAAHAELCSHLPGYAEDTVRRASYSEGLVSLPTAGGQCDGADCLTGRARELWVGWQKHLLREGGPPDGPRLRPFSDPKLVHCMKTYSRFVGELLSRGLIDLGERTESTVGIFFVFKSDKRSLRMIADTRVANMRFRPPAYSELPTAGAWSSLVVPEGKSLHLAQMDVDNAFYRIATPPGLREHFVLPAVDLEVLRAERPDLAGQLPAWRKASPRLVVLAMGWNWSLFFCQQMVETQVLRSGLAWERLARDRHPTPALEEGPAAAVYVDGAAVVGLDYAETLETGQRVRDSLDAAGLTCKGLEGPSAEATFTGLVFDEAKGRVGLSRRRMWRIRLSLLHVADRGSATGDEVRVLLGHFTWGALVRRELLSIFSAAYRFATWAGGRRRRLWSAVEAELRIAAALVVFGYVDCRRRPDPVVLATDACGATDADAGGFGVVSRAWDPRDVGRACAQAERWRYRVSEAVSARAHALGLSECPPAASLSCAGKSSCPPSGTPLARTPPPASDFDRAFGDMYSGTVSFEQITSEHVGSFESWQLRVKGRFNRAENIIRLEGHGLVIGIRHHLRAVSRRGRKLLMLCDNLGLVLALGKGRAAAPIVNRTCREAAALSILGDMSVTVRWVPSELNPADRPSRMAGASARDPRADPRSASFDPAAAPPCDAAAALHAAVDEALLGGELDWLGRPQAGVAGLGDALLDDPLPGGAARLHAEAAPGGDALDERSARGELATWGGLPASEDSSSSGSDAGSDCGETVGPSTPRGDGPGRPGEPARVVERIGRRAARRRSTAASAPPVLLPGGSRPLGFLESRRVTEKSRDTLCREVGAFREWCRAHRKDVSSRTMLDEALVEYLDCLYFDGYNHERGDKLLSGLAFEEPMFRRGGVEDLARARAALQGFRRLAPGQARMPLPRPEFAALLGAGIVALGLDFGISLAIAWDGGLRLPSDIMSLQGRSLIPPPPHSGVTNWGLLLYPAEAEARSKSGHKDEGLLLDGAFTKGIEAQLWRLKRAAGETGCLWSFTAAEFRAGFKRAAAMIGRPSLHPYQVRHGAASDDALYRRRTLTEIQERLRHSHPKSTLRYKKHTRYLAELGKVPPRVRAYGEAVEAQIAAVLSGRLAGRLRRLGDTLVRNRQLAAGAVRAGLSDALRRELGGAAACYLDLFAGSGGVARALRRLHCVSLEMDLRQSEFFDLASKVVGQTIVGWISSRLVLAVFAAFPCSTWSQAAHNYYRNPRNIYGHPHLEGEALERLLIGNATL